MVVYPSWAGLGGPGPGPGPRLLPSRPPSHPSPAALGRGPAQAWSPSLHIPWKLYHPVLSYVVYQPILWSGRSLLCAEKITLPLHKSNIILDCSTAAACGVVGTFVERTAPQRVYHSTLLACVTHLKHLPGTNTLDTQPKNSWPQHVKHTDCIDTPLATDSIFRSYSHYRTSSMSGVS